MLAHIVINTRQADHLIFEYIILYDKIADIK